MSRQLLQNTKDRDLRSNDLRPSQHWSPGSETFGLAVWDYIALFT